MNNPNQELLTWAVENITEWNDDYTHLRSDSTLTPFFTKNGRYGWHPGIYPRDWVTNEIYPEKYFKNLDKEFSTKTLQVITKQEYIDAVNALKTSQEVQQGHIHAAIMAEYAEVAKTNPEPWKEFQVQWDKCGGWYEVELLYFSAKHNYRRKPSPPKTMKIGGIVVEACPLKHYGHTGSGVWTILCESGKFGVYTFNHTVCKFDEDLLYAGYVFATQQEAQAVADALNNLYKKAVDEAWNS